MAEQFDLISQNSESTVVAEYERPERERETSYQTEAELERAFIAQLGRQGYDYLPIHSEAELIENLRRQLERLNGITLTDGKTIKRYAPITKPEKLAKDIEAML